MGHRCRSVHSASLAHSLGLSWPKVPGNLKIGPAAISESWRGHSGGRVRASCPLHDGLRAKLFEALDLYEVPLNKRASTIGFAVQKAIDAGKETLDPTIAADIVTECAVPAAKFDPSRFL